MDNDHTLSNMMNLAKLFAPTATSNTNATSGDKAWPMYPLDAQIHTEPLRVCKSLIPYLPLEKQKNISIFIKAYELISVINHYADLDALEEPSSHFRKSDTWQIDLLHSVKESLDPANAYWVDILFKINDVRGILASAQSGSSSEEASNLPAASNPPTPPKGNSQEFIDNIAPMLDDNQRKILETLSSFMK